MTDDAGGHSLSYDRVLACTGVKAMLPPVIPGVQRETRNSGEINGVPVPCTNSGNYQANLGWVLVTPGASPLKDRGQATRE